MGWIAAQGGGVAAGRVHLVRLSVERTLSPKRSMLKDSTAVGPRPTFCAVGTATLTSRLVVDPQPLVQRLLKAAHTLPKR